MLVMYNKPNLLSVPLINSKNILDKTIHFSPGVNSLSTNDWERCKKFPKVNSLLDNGVMRVEHDKDDSNEKFAISDAPVNKAVTIIKKTYNPLLLEDWRAAETRAGVVKAINAQLKYIEEQTQPNKEAAN